MKMEPGQRVKVQMPEWLAEDKGLTLAFIPTRKGWVFPLAFS